MQSEPAVCNLFEEGLIGFTQAAREEFRERLRANRPISPVTLHRWARFGVRTPAGRIKLESVFVAGRRATSRQACRRFKEAVNAAKCDRSPEEASDR